MLWWFYVDRVWAKGLMGSRKGIVEFYDVPVEQLHEPGDHEFLFQTLCTHTEAFEIGAQLENLYRSLEAVKEL